MLRLAGFEGRVLQGELWVDVQVLMVCWIAQGSFRRHVPERLAQAFLRSPSRILEWIIVEIEDAGLTRLGYLWAVLFPCAALMR
mmetsp:Transcript_150121/g.482503  ORF Transcript_150121/g.482503 Transcript_150121/m.482503 type:complete len:84 (+) Transcript_150121:2035-2286(+)